MGDMMNVHTEQPDVRGARQEKSFCVLRFEVSKSVIIVHETHAAL